MLKIDKNIPVPTRRFSLSDYMFQDLEVGDSFLIPKEERNKYQVAANRHTNKKFTIRSVSPDHCRCWRIK